MLYKGFATREELDVAYDLEATVEDVSLYSDFYARESEKVRSEMEHRLGVSFGPTLAEHLDLYPAGSGAPVLVYVHGGYWRSRTSREFGFVARGPASGGVATVVVNYALCPFVTIGEILRQVRAAVVWTHENAGSFGGDRESLHVAGHSAGAHLTAMLLLTDWEGEYGLPRDVVKGATAVSGIYDLAPLPYTFLQPDLQLTWREVLSYSPILHAPDDLPPPLLLAYGEEEPPEIKRQSEDFLAAWKTKGHAVDGPWILPGKNHYGIVDGFLDPDSALCSAVLERMGVGR